MVLYVLELWVIISLFMGFWMWFFCSSNIMSGISHNAAFPVSFWEWILAAGVLMGIVSAIAILISYRD